MSEIKVSITVPNKDKEVKPSKMPSCVPFVAMRENCKPHVLLRTGAGAFIFFHECGDISYTCESEVDWVDENYKVIPHAEATITLKV